MERTAKMKKIRLVVGLLWLLAVAGFARTPVRFVQVQGMHFSLDGQRYCFLGTNMWYGVNLGALAEGGDRARLVRELDRLKELGVTNLRIMGASEGLGQPKTVQPPIQPEPGVYDQRLLQGLDFLLAEMAKRDMKAVIYLNNYWIWTGGMAQYVAWAIKQPLPNPFISSYTWPQFMNFSARFYRQQQAQKWYEQYVRTLILRKNTITGVAYKDDPTIMAWQLANEPRPGQGQTGQANVAVFEQWIHRTAAFIRSLDKHHLITTGNEGVVGCLGNADLYRKINNDPNIDYLTFHLWAFNWGWYDPSKAQATFDSTLIKARRYIQQHIQLARELGKPLVLEEFGLPRDGHSYSPESGTRYRDRYYRNIYKWVWQNARNNGPLAGSNFWAWGGEGRPRDAQHAEWRTGDPFTGDPPQEPQGLNSVFDCDSSTLKIMDQYAKRMNTLESGG